MKKIKLVVLLSILVISLNSCEFLEIDHVAKYEVTCEDCPNGFDVIFINTYKGIGETYVSTKSWDYYFDYAPGETVSIIVEGRDEQAKLNAKIYFNEQLVSEGTNVENFPRPYVRLVKKL